jgi:hypothetical protein
MGGKVSAFEMSHSEAQNKLRIRRDMAVLTGNVLKTYNCKYKKICKIKMHNWDIPVC